ncbi:GNAT family N-acetyltransferase [Silvibacterium dinghuense]|uniref:GNAT family N-acetyltransferase n=1 Tax=Silvibacterium dinghuense TaxID=1560006 RepID=A0A4Q1SJG3_9BACT|nr:GNAT family N-acetyltransferase [Silvibacterium dinghuense]RXS97794.1 GNAT family N-acetyltransferase [Silvibacterium dinghuense]GGH02025.1 acetyltransferase [Silvibacterium dinghuense]
MDLSIRPATPNDSDAVWAILEPMLRGGETYALPRDMTRDEALAYWFSASHSVFAAEIDGRIAGTFYLRPIQPGPGSHIANCGYVTAPWAGGRGVARAMCRYSLGLARQRGYRAMQFNFVVSTNEAAVHLWSSLGFSMIARLPGAFHHPRHGYVDALVMYHTLEGVDPIEESSYGGSPHTLEL